MTVARFIPAFVLLACAVACTPTHNVKPLPNFVQVGLEPGDRVTVTTHDGETHDLVITEIRGDVLVGGDAEFALQHIASIKKHAWKRPESPCGGEKPLGCSLPLLVSVASETHRHYQEKFYDACAQHDYCYRHGFASYGMDRKGCDDAFLTDMQNSCPDEPGSRLGKVLDVLIHLSTRAEVAFLLRVIFMQRCVVTARTSSRPATAPTTGHRQTWNNRPLRGPNHISLEFLREGRKEQVLTHSTVVVEQVRSGCTRSAS